MTESITAADVVQAISEVSKVLVEIKKVLQNQCEFMASEHKYTKQIASDSNEIKEKMKKEPAKVLTEKSQKSAPFETIRKRKKPSFTENSIGSTSTAQTPVLTPSLPSPRVLPASVKRPKIKCIACQNYHMFEKCNVYRDHISRARFLAENGLCQHCTNLISVCQGENFTCSCIHRKCQKCGQQHLNALCPVAFPVLPPMPR